MSLNVNNMKNISKIFQKTLKNGITFFTFPDL
jgi:hypothetical protein